MKKVIFISPMFNAGDHLIECLESTYEQTNQNFVHYIIDDMSTDNSAKIFKDWCIDKNLTDNRYILVSNSEKKWALKNVIEVARLHENEDVIVSILDADDKLYNKNTINLLIENYDDSTDTVWTAHKWDINDLNISRELPERVNPYQFPWCTSHLKTFRSSLLKKISDKNFKDLDDKWFKRGYDQALYLPLLFLSRKRKFVDSVCYYYRINSSSIKVRDWNEKDQMDTVRLVRARGFIGNV